MTSFSINKVDQIVLALRKEITEGAWAVGETIPKETLLADRFDCSVGTMNKALSLIAHDGLVERKPRAGTRVVRRDTPARKTGDEKGLDAFAFIYPSTEHPGIQQTVLGFQEAARKANRRMVMLMTGIDYQKEVEHLARLSEFDVRGAVLYPIVPTPRDLAHLSQLLVESRFPLVLASVHLPGLGCSSVMVDGFHAGYSMTRHMLDRGLRRIGFLSNNSWSSSMRDRYQGYHWALQEAGIEELPGRVLREQTMNINFQDLLREPTELGRRILASGGDLEGIVCANDYLALGCIRAAREAGRKVPDDLRVSGIDDYDLSAAGEVPLTTYRIPYDEVGRRTFALLEEVVADPSRGAREMQVPGSVVVRESA